MRSCDESIFTLSGDGEVLESVMECELQDETEQNGETVRIILDPGQPSKRERGDHEAIHA